MIDKNLILYLPFDDPEGSKAYDYSHTRADAILSEGASFTKDAKIGKSLALNLTGECISPTAIPLNADFTLCMYLKPESNRIGWLLSLPGIDKYLEQWLDVVPNEWIFLAFAKSAKTFTVYQNYEKIYSGSMEEHPVGFSLNDSNLVGVNALLDEVRLFNVTKSARDIFLLQKDTDVEYYIDGKNFKDYGVYVSGSAGLVGRLERKDSLQVDWDNYHGVVRDKKRLRFKERTIELECFIEAGSRDSYVDGLMNFLSLFDGDGTHRLKIEYAGKTKPLVYEVVLLDDVDTDKKWSRYNKELMVAKFKLKLIEDEPVKQVLRHIGGEENTTAEIIVSSFKLLNIYWGDGSHTYNVSGSNTMVTHEYALPGEYDIIITGVIEDIESLSTNAIVVWELLK